MVHFVKPRFKNRPYIYSNRLFCKIYIWRRLYKFKNQRRKIVLFLSLLSPNPNIFLFHFLSHLSLSSWNAIFSLLLSHTDWNMKMLIVGKESKMEGYMPRSPATTMVSLGSKQAMYKLIISFSRLIILFTAIYGAAISTMASK